MGLAIVRHEFKDLLALSWAAPAEPLRARLPAGLGLDLDLFEGKAYVTVAVLTLAGLRAGFIRVPKALGFTSYELNVRTYVRLHGDDPGIWFLSLDTTSRTLAVAARAVLGLPAFRAEVRLERDPLVWHARRGDATFRARFEPQAAVGTPEPGSLDHFLLERSALHTPSGRVVRIRREPFAMRTARVLDLVDSFAGIGGPPARAHYIASSEVDIIARL